MGLLTKATGRWAEHTDWACSSIQREKCIRGTGYMIRLKDRGPMCIQTELNTKANGSKTYNREKASRSGLMVSFS